MKNDEVIYLILGAGFLYLLARNSTGTNATQAALNTTALNAQNTVSNANIIGSAAGTIATDLASIGA